MVLYKYKDIDNGKLGESQGRKAMGLPELFWWLPSHRIRSNMEIIAMPGTLAIFYLLFWIFIEWKEDIYCDS